MYSRWTGACPHSVAQESQTSTEMEQSEIEVDALHARIAKHEGQGALILIYVSQTSIEKKRSLIYLNSTVLKFSQHQNQVPVS